MTYVELKTDFWSTVSGNVCIEMYGRKGQDGRRRESGLSVTTSKYWAYQVVGKDHRKVESVLLFTTASLRELVARWKRLKGKGWLTPMGDDDASLGAMIPFSLLLPGADWEEEERKERERRVAEEEE